MPRNIFASFLLAIGLTIGGSLVAAPAKAQVIEIAADGAAMQVGPGWQAPAAASPALESPSGPPPAYRQAIARAALRYDLSPELLDAVARSESGYDPDVVSAAGAIGIMQLMPGTARSLGVDPWDPEQNIMGGAAYLRGLIDRFDGDLERAFAGYNAGPERVVQYQGVPPFRETRAYVGKNLDRLAAMSLAFPVFLTATGASE